ncbi:unnamed protein product, partial [Mesorhabditis spiculigera]
MDQSLVVYYTHDLLVNDFGQYSCVIKTKTGNEASTLVNFYARPIFNTSIQIDIHEKSGASLDAYEYERTVYYSNVTLHCFILAWPIANVVWKKNGNVIIDDDLKYNIAETNRSLTITDFLTSDNGTYACEAENSFPLQRGEKPTTFQLSLEFTVFVEETAPLQSSKAWMLLIPGFLVLAGFLITAICYGVFWKKCHKMNFVKLCGHRYNRAEVASTSSELQLEDFEEQTTEFNEDGGSQQALVGKDEEEALDMRLQTPINV